MTNNSGVYLAVGVWVAGQRKLRKVEMNYRKKKLEQEIALWISRGYSWRRANAIARGNRAEVDLRVRKLREKLPSEEKVKELLILGVSLGKIADMFGVDKQVVKSKVRWQSITKLKETSK